MLMNGINTGQDGKSLGTHYISERVERVKSRMKWERSIKECNIRGIDECGFTTTTEV